MGYKAIYAYPWDLVETGVSAAIDRFQALGLDTVTVAGSYHAGKFLRPHGRSGQGLFSRRRDGLFQARSRRYGAIKPIANSMLSSGQDMVGELSRQDRLATNVWLVLLHNTRLGAAHIESDGRQRLRRPIRLQSLPLRARGARLRDRARARRHGILPGQRRVAGDARFPALRARLPSRIRAQPAEIAGSTACLAFASARTAWRAPNARGFASRR